MKMVDTVANNPARKYREAEGIVLENMGETMLVVHLGTDQIFELNSTATRLVELLLSGKTDIEAARIIADEYGVDLEVVLLNVEQTVSHLVTEKVLENFGSPGF